MEGGRSGKRIGDSRCSSRVTGDPFEETSFALIAGHFYVRVWRSRERMRTIARSSVKRGLPQRRDSRFSLIGR